MTRRAIFIVELLWIVVLAAFAVLFFVDGDRLRADAVGPLGAVWFGALGAVLTSLSAVAEHGHDWDESTDLWHLSRPLMGAACGLVGVLLFKAGVVAVAAGSPAPTLPQNILYFIVAFLVGYREQTFRELMKRVVDLVVGPAVSKAPPTIAKVDPPKARPGNDVPIVIEGTGFSGVTSIVFGSRAAEFHIDSDARLTAHLPKAESPPAAATVGPVPVVIKNSAGSASSTFEYTA